MASKRASLIDRVTPSTNGRRRRSLPPSQERYVPRILFADPFPPSAPLESDLQDLVYSRAPSRTDSEMSAISGYGYAGDVESVASGWESNEEVGSEAHSQDESIDVGCANNDRDSESEQEIEAYIPEAIWEIVESFAIMSLGESPESSPESVSTLPDYETSSNDEDFANLISWRYSAPSDSSESQIFNDLFDSAYGSEAVRHDQEEMVTDADSNDSLLQLNQDEHRNCRKRRLTNETDEEIEGSPEKIQKSE